MLSCVPGSSVGIATELPGWTVQDRIPVTTSFSARPDRPWGPPSLLYNGYQIFPAGKLRPGRAADHSPPSSAAVMEQYSYTSTHPLGHTGPVTGSVYLYLFYRCLAANKQNKQYISVYFTTIHTQVATFAYTVHQTFKPVLLHSTVAGT